MSHSSKRQTAALAPALGLAVAVVGAVHHQSHGTIARNIEHNIQSSHNTDLLSGTRRTILGGAAADDVASIRLTGSQTSRNRGDGRFRAPEPLELRAMFPANYVQIRTGSRAVTWMGFRGDILVNVVLARHRGTTILGRTAGPDETLEELRNQQERFAALALGLLAKTDTALVLKLRSISHTDENIRMEFAGSGDFNPVLDVNSKTGLPVRVHHRGDVRFPGVVERRTDGRRIVSVPPRERTDITWTFGKWREIGDGGVRVPHEVAFMVRGLVLDSYRFTEIDINQVVSVDFRP